MSKQNWVFIWEKERVKNWSSTSRKLNTVVDFNEFLKIHDKEGIAKKTLERYNYNVENMNMNVPANKTELPDFLKNISITNNLNGQIIDQFENESFKYVLQKHVNSRYNSNHPLVIKEHLYPDIALDENNCKTLDLDHINKLLEENAWVGLGTFFEKPENEFNKLSAVASSVYFTRDVSTNKLKNLSKIKQFNPRLEYLSGIVYVVFRKLKDRNINVAMLNPNLISLTHFTNLFNEKHNITTISEFKNMKDHFIKPKVLKGVVVNENNIFSDNGVVEIELMGSSSYKYMHGHKPSFAKKIITNLDYTLEKDILKIEVVKNGYVIIEYDIGDIFQYDVDRNKTEKERVEFLLFE